MKANSSDHGVEGISRRSFVKITVGSIVMLPTVANAMLLPAEAALADSGEVAELVGGSRIHIVRSSELGLVVRDVSREKDTASLVVGAHVKITSRFNGNVVDGYTDDNGGITFDISQLSEDDGKKETPARYRFNATIEVSAPGFRTFRADLYRVEGGTAISIPTQPTMSGVPYPVSASFDEWDVLYTVGDSAAFVSSSGNDVDHTIGLRLADCPAGAAITAGIFADGVQVATTSAKAASDGTAQIDFKDTFLLSSSSVALPTGDQHSFTARYTVNNTTFEVPIKPTIDPAPPESQQQRVEKDLELAPFNDTAMFLGITVPEGWPIIGGHRLQLWKPMLPFDIAFDPFGFIRIKATTPEWGYIRDNGKPDPNAWKFHPRTSAKDQFEKLKSQMADQVADTFAALGREGRIKQIGFTSKLSFTAQLEIMAAATWEMKNLDARGRAQVALRVGANYSLMETFWAGPFPIVITFGIGLNAVAAGQVGFISQKVFNFVDYRWDWNSLGFDLQICFSPYLSVGVGIGGVFSLSLKGTFVLTYYLHEGPLPAGFENRPMPHVRLAGLVRLTIEIEILFFTDSYTIYESDWPDWYNNWDGVALKERSVPTPALQGAPLGDALNNAKIITEESMAALAEFSTAGVAAMSPKETQLTSYELFEKSANGEKPIAKLILSDEAVEKFAEAPSVLLVGQSADVADDRVTVVTGPSGDADKGLVAGSAVALTAQDDSQVEYVLRATNDGPMSRWETTMPAATPIGDHSYVAIPSARPGVLGLGKERGFLTGTDVRIADNILSASRFKFFSAGERDYIARLGVIMVGGKARTRIIAEQIGGSDRRVIDFMTQYNRDNWFDYDFDISTTHVNGELLVNMVVISGTRPNGDATSLTTAAGQTYFSFLSCQNWNGRATFYGLALDATTLDAISDRGIKYKYRNYSCPRIRQIVGTKNGVQYGQAVVTFLERASIQDWAIMSDNRNLTKAGVGLLFFNDVKQTVCVDGMITMYGIMDQIDDDPSLTEVTLSERENGWHVITLKGYEKTRGDDKKPYYKEKMYYVLVETDPCYAIAGEWAVPMVTGANLVDLGDYEGKVGRLVPVNGQGHFLTCVDGKLKKVQVVAANDHTASLKFSDIEGEPININEFGVAGSGDVLYWPATREDGGYAIDENGDHVLRDGEAGEVNLIMGARLRNGKVARPMVLSEVTHPMHRIRSFEQSDNYLSFISSTTVDLAKGKGEQWYTAVPWVRCATLVDAEPYTTVLAKGDHLAFNLMLRNDGNCFLSRVELAVAEVGHDPIGTITLAFSKDNTLESEWNPRGEDGELQNVEDDWALAPGMSSRYYAEYVTIPDTWEGDKEVEVYITAVHASGSSVLATKAEDSQATQAERDSIEYIPERRARYTLTMDGEAVEVTYAGTYGKADVTVMGSPKEPEGEGEKGGGGTSASTKASPSKSGLPSTGDTISLAALALAGVAGVAAHRAFRSREDTEEGEE